MRAAGRRGGAGGSARGRPRPEGDAPLRQPLPQRWRGPAGAGRRGRGLGPAACPERGAPARAGPAWSGERGLRGGLGLGSGGGTAAGARRPRRGAGPGPGGSRALRGGSALPLPGGRLLSVSRPARGSRLRSPDLPIPFLAPPARRRRLAELLCRLPLLPFSLRLLSPGLGDSAFCQSPRSLLAASPDLSR